ncbi:hypothetical protein AABB24_020414, partial [Solanum stoloniferum]
YIFTGNFNSQFNYVNNHTISAVALAILLDSAELLKIVLCFLAFQDINEFPIFTTKSVTNYYFFVIGQVARFVSQCTISYFDTSNDKRIPKLGALLRYLTTLNIASVWYFSGMCMN